MEIIFIAAMSENHVIGIHGQLPWRLPNDLRRFKELTVGEHIVMGRKTYESIGKPLPLRHNMVLTRDQNFHAPGIEVMHSKEEILSRDYARIVIIGGEEIYRLFLPDCDKIHLTLVHTTLTGDAYFPELTGFTITAREDHSKDSRHQFSYSFIEYVKRAP